MTRAYIDAMWDTPKIEIAKAFLMSWCKLFLAGGASQLSRYLGLNAPATDEYLWNIKQVTQDVRNIVDNWMQNSSFWVLFLITTSYTVISRAVGLIGILVMIRDRATLRYTFLHVGTIAIFLAMYLFSGISRFRAPLEPALALFFAIGIGVLFKRHNRVKEKTTQQFDHPRAEDGND